MRGAWPFDLAFAGLDRDQGPGGRPMPKIGRLVVISCDRAG